MMITAHSGADGTPDNSLAFVRYALTLAPDALEVDVHRRADGVLAIAHDTDESGRYEGCPTLAEVFALVREQPAIGLNCDCKDAGLEEQVVAQHAAEAPQNPLFLSGTVSPRTLIDHPEIKEHATVLLNAEEIVRDFYERLVTDSPAFAATGREAAEACLACGAKVVNVNFNACAEEFQRELDARGVGVSVWTVGDLDKARDFAARGVFNITTRNAKALLGALR